MNNPMNPDELLKCPFCGSDEISVISQPLFDTARCSGCMAIGPAAGDKMMATHHWNRRAPSWIAVGERLPEKDGPYLCFSKRQEYETREVFYFEGKHWYFTNGEGDVMEAQYVTHWQPIAPPPQPPEE